LAAQRTRNVLPIILDEKSEKEPSDPGNPLCVWRHANASSLL